MSATTSNAQKTPFIRSQNRFADQKIRSAIQLAGKALPCRVAAIPKAGVPIVTVQFLMTGIFTLPNITVPLAGPEYSRPPTQIGDQGVCFPADVYLGGVSGLGGGTADFTLQGNLAALVFFPLGNTSFRAVDPSVFTLYGPGGVTLEDSSQAMQLLLTPTQIDLAGTGGQPVARVGDHTVCPAGAGIIVSGSPKVNSN